MKFQDRKFFLKRGRGGRRGRREQRGTRGKRSDHGGKKKEKNEMTIKKNVITEGIEPSIFGTGIQRVAIAPRDRILIRESEKEK